MTKRIAALICVLTVFAGATFAKGPKITDPKKADADFKIQGEYSGELKTGDGKDKFGVQVIALGNGEFQCVGYHGGLPGDGWNGENKVIVKAKKAEDGSVTFKDKHGTGVIKDGKMTVDLGSDGSSEGSLARIERKSPTLGQKPPQGAVVLYSGPDDVDKWKNGKASEDGYLMQGTTSKQAFGSHKIHIEFRIPYQPEDRGQGRGNSGIYVQGRYECQMLDSFGLEGKNNECGGLYSVKDTDVNMCLPPLQWQTYDIDYTAAKFKDGKLVENPRMTVSHNGVVIHKDVEMPGERSTTAAPSKPGPEPGAVYLQNHGCPVRYRNIWVVETK